MSGLDDESVPYSGSPGSDAEWHTVRQALANDKWDFRTVDGIARETGIAADRVLEILESHPGEVRKSMVPDNKGRVLYTLQSRSKSFRELIATARAFVAKST